MRRPQAGNRFAHNTTAAADSGVCLASGTRAAPGSGTGGGSEVSDDAVFRSVVEGLVCDSVQTMATQVVLGVATQGSKRSQSQPCWSHDEQPGAGAQSLAGSTVITGSASAYDAADQSAAAFFATAAVLGGGGHQPSGRLGSAAPLLGPADTAGVAPSLEREAAPPAEPTQPTSSPVHVPTPPPRTASSEPAGVPPSLARAVPAAVSQQPLPAAAPVPAGAEPLSRGAPAAEHDARPDEAPAAEAVELDAAMFSSPAAEMGAPPLGLEILTNGCAAAGESEIIGMVADMILGVLTDVHAVSVAEDAASTIASLPCPGSPTATRSQAAPAEGSSFSDPADTNADSVAVLRAAMLKTRAAEPAATLAPIKVGIASGAAPAAAAEPVAGAAASATAGARNNPDFCHQGYALDYNEAHATSVTSVKSLMAGAVLSVSVACEGSNTLRGRPGDEDAAMGAKVCSIDFGQPVLLPSLEKTMYPPLPPSYAVSPKETEHAVCLADCRAKSRTAEAGEDGGKGVRLPTGAQSITARIPGCGLVTITLSIGPRPDGGLGDRSDAGGSARRPACTSESAGQQVEGSDQQAGFCCVTADLMSAVLSAVSGALDPRFPGGIRRSSGAKSDSGLLEWQRLPPCFSRGYSARPVPLAPVSPVKEHPEGGAAGSQPSSSSGLAGRSGGKLAEATGGEKSGAGDFSAETTRGSESADVTRPQGCSGSGPDVAAQGIDNGGICGDAVAAPAAAEGAPAAAASAATAGASQGDKAEQEGASASAPASAPVSSQLLWSVIQQECHIRNLTRQVCEAELLLAEQREACETAKESVTAARLQLAHLNLDIEACAEKLTKADERRVGLVSQERRLLEYLSVGGLQRAEGPIADAEQFPDVPRPTAPVLGASAIGETPRCHQAARV